MAGLMVRFPPAEADYEFELDANTGTEVVVVLAYSSRVAVDHAERDCERIRAST